MKKKSEREYNMLKLISMQVLGQGKLIEVDTPQNLLRNPKSHFYSMVHTFKDM